MKSGLYLDADDTIWDVYPNKIVSLCRPPYKRVTDDILVGGFEFDPCFIVLKPKVRDLIEFAKRHDFDVVMVSQNDEKPLREAINEFGLDFDRVYAVVYENKIEVIEDDMIVHGIDDAVFADDSVEYVIKAYAKNHDNYVPDNIVFYNNIYSILHDFGLL